MGEISTSEWSGSTLEQAQTKAAVSSYGFARAAIVAIILYHLLLTVMIFIRPDLDPYWHTISEYAIGPYGWIMMLAFWTGGLSYICLFVVIRRHIHGFFGKAGLGILLICILGLLGVGWFVTDPLNTRPENMTTTGILHLISGASQLVLLPFAALLINLNLARRNVEWRSVRLPLLATAGLPLIGFAGFMIHFSIYLAPLGENAYGPDVPIGWPPRIMFLTYAIWVTTLAFSYIQVGRVRR